MMNSGSGLFVDVTASPFDYPKDVTTTHLDFLNNTGELYVENAFEVDGTCYLDGNLEHTGSGTSIGFFGVGPVTQPGAYTQTYATADKTHAALTSATLTDSTGGTAKLIAEAGYKVVEVGEYTGWPEMATGLVKSMNPKLYVGMLAHSHTASDAEYMAKHKVPAIDMVLANFYPFENAVADHPVEASPTTVDDEIAAVELIRQNMDVGGPTAVHTSRKGYLTTAVATRPEDYARFAADLIKHDGCIGLESRFIAMQHCSEDLARYYVAISDFVQKLTVDNVRKAYPTIHNAK